MSRISVVIVGGLAIGVVVGAVLSWDMPLSLQMLTTVVAFSIYFRYSRTSMSAVGVLFLSLGIFSGLAGIWLSVLGLQGDPDVAVWVSVSILVGTVLAAAVVVFSERRFRDVEEAETESSSGGGLRSGAIVGIVLMAVSFLLSRVPSAGPLSGAFAYLGVLTFGIGAAREFRTDPRSRIFVLFAGLTGVGLFYYLTYVFNGFGRLVIAELGLGLLIIWSVVRPSGWYRWVVGVGIVLAIVLGSVAGIVRSAGGSISEAWNAVISNSAVIRGDEDVGGISSVYAPLKNTTTLMDLRNHGVESVAGWRFGRSYANAVLVPVPRVLWPDKPIQLNAEIVATLSPHLVGIGHSEAIGLWGEAFLSFGLLGVVVAAVLAAYLAALGDRWYRRRRVSSLPEMRDLALLVFASTASGIPDLVWGDSETFSSRAGIRLLILAGMYLVVRRFVPSTSRTEARGGHDVGRLPAQ